MKTVYPCTEWIMDTQQDITSVMVTFECKTGFLLKQKFNFNKYQTIAELKTQLHRSYHIPVQCQTWVLKNKPSDDRLDTLHKCKIAPNEGIFVYINTSLIAHATSQESWTCDNCSAKNGNNSVTCKACDEPRRERANNPSTSQLSERWLCSNCTFDNTGEAANCGMCLNQRNKPNSPAQQRPAQQRPAQQVFQFTASSATPKSRGRGRGSLMRESANQMPQRMSTSASHGVAPEKPTKQSSQWTCEVCYQKNESGTRVCEICQSPRENEEDRDTRVVEQIQQSPQHNQNIPKQDSLNTRHAATGEANGNTANAADWVCPLCTFVNRATRPGCEICANEKPGNLRTVHNSEASG